MGGLLLTETGILSNNYVSFLKYELTIKNLTNHYLIQKNWIINIDHTNLSYLLKSESKM